MSDRAIIKTFLWSIFSATLAVTAITLPVHIIASLMGKDLNVFQPIFHQIYILIVVLSAVYLSVYRIYTLLLDLGLEHWKKSLGMLAMVTYLIFAALAVLKIF